MNNTQEIKEYITTLEDLTEAEKANFLARLDGGEDTVAILEELETLLQKKLDQVFDEAGITIDENDPEYQAALQKAEAEIEAAQTEFNQTMDEIEKEGAQLQNAVVSQIEEDKVAEMRAKIAGI